MAKRKQSRKAVKAILFCAILHKVTQKLNLRIWENRQVIGRLPYGSAHLESENAYYQAIIDKIQKRLERQGK